jgi:uncharacterized membrane-anchored protein
MIGLVACASLVQNLKLTKVSAEYVMAEARTQFNLKHLTDAQYKTIGSSYDAIVITQKSVIDARVAYLKDPASPSKQAVYTAALNSLKANKTALEKAATNLKLDIGGGVE